MAVKDQVTLDKDTLVARAKSLRESIAEVITEAERLERIVAVWDGPAKARATSSTATRPSNNGSRAGRGARPAQFVAAVQESPGISANDIATEMECNVNYVYRLAKDNADQVEKRGKLFFPVGYEATETPEADTPAEDNTPADESVAA